MFAGARQQRPGGDPDRARLEYRGGRIPLPPYAPAMRCPMPAMRDTVLGTDHGPTHLLCAVLYLLCGVRYELWSYKPAMRCPALTPYSWLPSYASAMRCLVLT
eukprot:2527794-Rhodomonas_salina.1